MKDKKIRIGLDLFTAFLILSALFLSGSTFLPYKAFKAMLDLISFDGSLGTLTESFFKGSIKWLRVGGLCLSFISALLLIFRTRIRQHLLHVADSAVEFYASLVKYCKTIISDKDRGHLWLILIIISAGVIIRLFFLFRPMRQDECINFTSYALNPLHRAIFYGYDSNNHLLNTIFVHISYLLFGNYPWAIRLPAFSSGIMLAPLSYVATRILYNKYAGILTTVFVAFSPALISYSTNARGYTMICLSFLSILCLGAYLIKHANTFAWLLFAVFAALGFYAIPIMLYPFGMVLAWVLVSILSGNDARFKRKSIISLFISLAVTGLLVSLLYVPICIFSKLFWARPMQVLLALSKPKPFSSFTPGLISNLYETWNQWNHGVPPSIGLILLAGFFVSTIFHRRLSRYNIPIILGAALWIAPILAIQRVIPLARMWLFLLLIYFISASSGIVYLGRELLIHLSHRRKAIIYTTFIIMLSLVLCCYLMYTQAIYFLCDQPPLDDANDIVLFLKKGYLQPGDLIVTPNCNIVVLLYYFYTHNVPPGNFYYAELNTCNKVYVVIPADNFHSTRDIFNGYNLLNGNYTHPRLVKYFKHSALYEVVRKNTHNVA